MNGDLSPLAKVLLRRDQPGAQILYGVATANNTVIIAGSTIAVELPALVEVHEGDYCAVLAEGADRLILGRIEAEPWTAVSFTNGWSNASGGYQAAQYRRVGDHVQIRGRIAGGSSGTSAFTLPAGYRPPAGMSFPSIYSSGTPALVLVNIDTTGSVIPYGASLSLTAINFQFSLTA